jgi:hypothetical protein
MNSKIKLDLLDIVCLVIILVCSIGVAYHKGKLASLRETTRAMRKIYDDKPEAKGEGSDN